MNVRNLAAGALCLVATCSAGCNGCGGLVAGGADAASDAGARDAGNWDPRLHAGECCWQNGPTIGGVPGRCDPNLIWDSGYVGTPCGWKFYCGRLNDYPQPACCPFIAPPVSWPDGLDFIDAGIIGAGVPDPHCPPYSNPDGYSRK